ncbi:Txe/YoeB family addiction module toxin [Agromyces luteolus]|uniref:Txe/YoeB family addiction module toxin n=1 Tax=Agromyces luteolus TaxID=88373 RepID=UPI003B849AA7
MGGCEARFTCRNRRQPPPPIHRSLLRDPFAGIGKPEPLEHILSGAWSRRIDETNRLVYSVTDDHIVILQARDHY